MHWVGWSAHCLAADSRSKVVGNVRNDTPELTGRIDWHVGRTASRWGNV